MGNDDWRTSTLNFIHQKPVQIFLMSLLILDIIIIFVELFLMIEFPICKLVTRDCIACCGEEEHDGGDGHFRRWLASSDGGMVMIITKSAHLRMHQQVYLNAIHIS